MKNYLLEKRIELDHQNLDWNPNRLRTLKSLIKETSYFFVNLERFEPNPSIFEEGRVINKCIEGIYDQKSAESWVFMHLYGHAVDQANAIGILIERSCMQAGRQLWRSLFEAYVICEFLTIHRSKNAQIFQDYLSHSLLRSWIRYKGNYNNLCKEKGKDPHYDESEICWMKEKFKYKFGHLGNDYSWAKSIFEDKPTFRKMLDLIDSDMKIFYHLFSKEIHPTPGHRFVATDMCLPLPIIPIMPVNDVFNVEELYLEFLTAKPLIQMTNRASDFLILDESLRKRSEFLRALGNDVLDKLTNEVPSSN